MLVTRTSLRGQGHRSQLLPGSLRSRVRTLPQFSLEESAFLGWNFNYLTLSHKYKSSCLNKVNGNKYANLNLDGVNEPLMCKVKSN